MASRPTCPTSPSSPTDRPDQTSLPGKPVMIGIHPEQVPGKIAWPDRRAYFLF